MSALASGLKKAIGHEGFQKVSPSHCAQGRSPISIAVGKLKRAMNVCKALPPESAFDQEQAKAHLATLARETEKREKVLTSEPPSEDHFEIWRSHFEDWRVEIAIDADQAEQEHKKRCEDGWRGWANDAVTLGAKAAHRYTKLPTAWKPTETVSVGGGVTADPRQLLKGQIAKYKEMWQAFDVRPREVAAKAEAKSRWKQNRHRDQREGDT